MKTRKARIVLTDKTIEVGNIGDACWAELLDLNKWWQSGGSGAASFNYDFADGTPTKTEQFTCADIVRIELWPGSEEPR